MIELKHLSKIYHTKERDFIALKDVNITFEPGEFIAVLGESGSGKTTLLNMISGIDIPSDGTVVIDGKDTKRLSDQKWRELRNKEIGFIFQRFNLIDHLTVLDNVILPLILTGSHSEEAVQIAKKVLEDLGLPDIADKRANELSGGQRQRVAIARTIITNPAVILADEPTGALDSSTGKDILSLLQQMAAGRTIILVTHDEKLAYENATRVVRLQDGQVISDETLKPKNSLQRSLTDRLLTHPIKVTRRSLRHWKKTHPELTSSWTLGSTQEVPMIREYHPNAPQFIRRIARENYKQKMKTNRRIIFSFIISIWLLLAVNLIIKNMTNYNLNMFQINNNYQQFVIEGATSLEEAQDVLSQYNVVDEVQTAYSMYLQDLYFDERPLVSNVNAVNIGVFAPQLVSLPKNEANFYLNSQIIAGSYPSSANEILVSSEFILTRFYGISMSYENESSGEAGIAAKDMVGETLFVCGETILLPDEEIDYYVIEDECFGYEISGVLNSFYQGIDYTGKLFVPEEGFSDYITYLKEEKFFTRADEYYDARLVLYFTTLDTPTLIEEVMDATGYEFTNEFWRDYLGIKNLEDVLNFLFYAIFISLLIISGTVQTNIVSGSVRARIREIGIYSSIGVGKKSIQNMFLFETFLTATIVLLASLVSYGLLLGLFVWNYAIFVVDLTRFNPLFGFNPMMSYEASISVAIVGIAVLFLFINVIIPSYKASNMRAIDALSSS